MPGPLTLWLLAIVAGGIGMRRRDGSTPTGSGALAAGRPVLLCRFVERLAAVPVPLDLVDHAASRQVDADLPMSLLAGRCTALDVARARVALALAGLTLGLVAAAADPAAGLIGLALAASLFMLPAVVIRRSARVQRGRIVHQLPDLIDVVVLCSEAGMPLEPALGRAAARLPGACSVQILATLGEMDLGAPRREAYMRLAERVVAQEVRGLVGALLQADELGTPINEALSRQAELLRAARRQAVRDRAARAAPKVQLVVAMVMVPGALLVVVGVMVLQLIGQVGALTGAAG